MAELRSYWVTVEVERGQTRDHRIAAPTAWSAGWLWRQLRPGDAVVMVREVRG